tara:strand:- start:1241 stop:1951 length:711 start_codon:yes stop_codon:yes gene_type:complete
MHIDNIIPGVKRIRLNNLESLIDKAKAEFVDLEKNHNWDIPAARGDIKAGIKDIYGETTNEQWALKRACFFPWNMSIYNNIWELGKITRIQNPEISNPQEIWKIDEKGMFTYLAISIYKENSFIKEHVDMHRKVKSQKLLHTKLVLSEFGRDYIGGLEIRYHDEWRRIEECGKPGDIYIFDGCMPHRVVIEKGVRKTIFPIPTIIRRPTNFFSYSEDKKGNIFDKIKIKIRDSLYK